MNRRQIVASGIAGLLFGVLGIETARAGRPRRLKVLILGGTGFIGPHFVEALQAGQHKVTLFNRGRHNPGMFPKLETLIGDRDGNIDALKGRSWDVVIDNSGYEPRQVTLSTDVLRARVPHYIYISSVIAYADMRIPGIAEDYALAQLAERADEQPPGERYGALKAACEQIVEQTYGTASTIIRPTSIVGPRDSGTFWYWPVRVARGGDLLAPGGPHDPIQFIDVRDLADFIRLCVERPIVGRYNLCTPPGAITMGALLDTSRRLARSDANFLWASAEFLGKHGLLGNSTIPIWSPITEERAGGSLLSSAKAVARGLRFRSLATTVGDILDWYNSMSPAQRQEMHAGLDPAWEAALVAELKVAREASLRTP